MENSEIKQLKTKIKQDYVKLLDLLAKATDSVEASSISDISERERLLDAHNLANKFIGHALTILYLSHGTIIQDLPSFKKLIFPDSASINVLTRTAMEAFLVFHYVFFKPDTPEEKNYRYWAYKAAGLAERQNFPTITKEGRQMLDNDKIELDELRNKLESNKVFRALKDSPKRQIFEGKGKWRWEPGCKRHISWREIAIHAGFSRMLANHIYGHLSGYAHSGSLSVLQMRQALENKELEKLIKPSINLMSILTANMIQEYCGLFSKAQVVLTKDLEGSNLVKQYIQIGHELDKYMGTQVGE